MYPMESGSIKREKKTKTRKKIDIDEEKRLLSAVRKCVSCTASKNIDKDTYSRSHKLAFFLNAIFENESDTLEITFISRLFCFFFHPISVFIDVINLMIKLV